jgi:inhibitor of KinA
MKPLGDSALLVQFGTEMNVQTHLKVKALTDYLEANPFDGLIEYVPAFTSVTVFYDPVRIRCLYEQRHPSFLTEKKRVSPYRIVCSLMEDMTAGLGQITQAKQRTVDIPVCYGGEFGPDLEELARHHGLSQKEVIAIHSEAEYLVYMIGFAPGFPYLGGMSEKIATPRRSSPRLSIPAGSIGIAGMQTGIYPISTPGGWQIIGRTPIKLFDSEQDPPTLLQSGDLVRFRPISPEEYDSCKENV